ncbi:MAG: hypothetical protein ACP5KP_00605 [Candidatus Micrarchaeia archaeon]
MKPRQRTKPRKTKRMKVKRKRKKSLSKEKDCPGEIQIEKPKLEEKLGVPKLNVVPVKTEYQILGITDYIRNQIKNGIGMDKYILEEKNLDTSIRSVIKQTLFLILWLDRTVSNNTKMAQENHIQIFRYARQ